MIQINAQAKKVGPLKSAYVDVPVGLKASDGFPPLPTYLHADVKAAYAAGALIEKWSTIQQEWILVDKPLFLTSQSYRINTELWQKKLHLSCDHWGALHLVPSDSDYNIIALFSKSSGKLKQIKRV